MQARPTCYPTGSRCRGRRSGIAGGIAPLFFRVSFGAAVLGGKGEGAYVEMDRDYAPCSLNHELDKERAKSEGAPRAGQDPQRDKACA